MLAQFRKLRARAVRRLPAVRRLLSTLRQLSWGDRFLWIHAYVWLGIMRFAINRVPLKRLVVWFGARQAETPLDISTEHLAYARRVKWAITSAGQRTPWNSNCFPQATAAQHLLRRRGIGSTLYLGAAFDKSAHDDAATPHRQMKAHAWLRCGPYFVTGGRGHLHYGTVATFAWIEPS